MFWAERDNLEMALSLGVKYGQLGIPGGMHPLRDTRNVIRPHLRNRWGRSEVASSGQ